MQLDYHSEVNHVIEQLIQRGGQTLYDTYLNQKMPNECNENIMTKIQNSFNPMLTNKPNKSDISKIVMPIPSKIDLNTPHKIVIRSKSQNKMISTANNFFNTEIPLNTQKNESKFISYSKRAQSAQTISIKLENKQRQYNQFKIADQAYRKNRIQNQKLQIFSQRKSKQESQNIASQKKKLQDKIKQALKSNAPYQFDHEGNFYTVDSRKYREQQTKESKKKIKPFSLKYKTIEILSHGCGADKSNQMKVQGKIKGFSSKGMDKLKRKLRVSDRQFANNNERQYSSIPYIQMQSGSKILQFETNLMAQCTKKKQITRELHLAQSQKSINNLLRTISKDTYRSLTQNRPFTSDVASRAHSQLRIRAQSSLSNRFRPATSWTHRVQVSNKKLAIQMVQ